MNEDRFWEIIETTISASGGELDAQADALAEELRKLPPGEIAAFDQLFAVQKRKAYSWDLWVAAYIIKSGCSDDAFWYFLSWLISRGRVWFERAIKEADALADYPEPLGDGEAEFEDFEYVARTVYERAAGEMPRSTLPDLGQPKGDEWCEDDAKAFEERWPKLWEKYGLL